MYTRCVCMGTCVSVLKEQPYGLKMHYFKPSVHLQNGQELVCNLWVLHAPSPRKEPFKVCPILFDEWAYVVVTPFVNKVAAHRVTKAYLAPTPSRKDISLSLHVSPEYVSNTVPSLSSTCEATAMKTPNEIQLCLVVETDILYSKAPLQILTRPVQGVLKQKGCSIETRFQFKEGFPTHGVSWGAS